MLEGFEERTETVRPYWGYRDVFAIEENNRDRRTTERETETGDDYVCRLQQICDAVK
jgi:hypothetical protein